CPGPGLVVGHAVLDEGDGGDGLGHREDAEQDVLGAHVVVAQRLRLGRRQVDDPPGPGREPLEHQHLLLLPRPRRASATACFLWTAWRLTPSASAMPSHDQPWSRAFSTCNSSRPSSSLRRLATARSPTAGSWLLADAAK